MTNAPVTPERILQVGLGFWGSRTLLSAVELGLFTELAKTGERVFLLGAGGDILVANAVRDGLFEDKKVAGIGMDISGSNGFKKNFPLSFTFWVTDAGVEFIRRYAAGENIEPGLGDG